jgi:hypothetical protein
MSRWHGMFFELLFHLFDPGLQVVYLKCCCFTCVLAPDSFSFHLTWDPMFRLFHTLVHRNVVGCDLLDKTRVSSKKRHV